MCKTNRRINFLSKNRAKWRKLDLQKWREKASIQARVFDFKKNTKENPTKQKTKLEKGYNEIQIQKFLKSIKRKGKGPKTPQTEKRSLFVAKARR